MNNKEFFHSFFYSGKNADNHGNLSYAYPCFFSYSTTIGEIVETIDGGRVLLTSESSFSMTTAIHLSHLRDASPLPVVTLPAIRGQREFNAPAVLEHFKARADLSGYKITQKAERERLLTNFEMVKTCLTIVKFKPLFKDFKKLLKVYEKMAAVAIDPEKIKAEKARAAEKAKKARAALERRLRAFAKKPILEQITIAYSLPYDESKEMRQFLNPNHDLSFVWLTENGGIRTSKGLSFSVAEARGFARAYKAGKFVNGYKVGIYTVVQNTADFVKIGCHKIPRANLDQIAEKILNG